MLDKVSAAVVAKEINAQNDGTHPVVTPDDAANFTEVALSGSGGLSVYALSFRGETLVARIVHNEPFMRLMSFYWVKW